MLTSVNCQKLHQIGSRMASSSTASIPPKLLPSPPKRRISFRPGTNPPHQSPRLSLLRNRPHHRPSGVHPPPPLPQDHALLHPPHSAQTPPWPALARARSLRVAHRPPAQPRGFRVPRKRASVRRRQHLLTLRRPSVVRLPRRSGFVNWAMTANARRPKRRPRARPPPSS